MKKILIIGADNPEAPCEYCGAIADLRPYGKDGARICFPCGMLPENAETTRKMLNQVLDGKTLDPTNPQQN